MDFNIIHLIHAVILGIVEGVTEYLPVSSTGHLILVGDALGFTGGKESTFDVFIQLGGILAVVVLYPKRFTNLLSSQVGGFSGREGIIKLGLACAPAFVAGALLRKVVKQHLFFPASVAVALIVGGILMILLERRKQEPRTKALEEITFAQALGIGLCQCVSLWPGFSRSGATIMGGMFLGVSRVVAAEFSFLVAVPVMCGAVTYEMYKSWALLSMSDIPVFATGFVVSFVVAVIAIRFLVAMLQRYTLIPFAVYRIILGAVVLAVMVG